jgi:hypothetical protein
MNLDLSNSSFTLQWWIEGTLVSEVKSPESGDGFVYFCEACEAVWAAKYFPNRAIIKFYGACPKHPSSRGEVPGSLVLWWHDELERMPAVLVEREYDIHLTHYLTETAHERDTLERQAA